MNGLVAISDQVCNKWLVSTHLSVNNSPVQLIFNQSAREPCLQRQQILTTRAPPSYANDPQDAQEVWIIIIINITQLPPARCAGDNPGTDCAAEETHVTNTGSVAPGV